MSLLDMTQQNLVVAQSAWAVEYNDDISAEE